MASSMTGFSRAERESAQGKLVLELKTLNHRYLELNIRLPESLRFTETMIRSALRRALSRGKIEVSLQWQSHDGNAGAAQLDPLALAALREQLDAVNTALPDSSRPDALDILRWPGVLRPQPLDEGALEASVAALLESGLQLLSANRQREGDALTAALQQRLTEMTRIVATLREAEPELQAFLFERLQERAEKIKADVAPDRLAQELVILAQKADVAEELDRLDAHIAETMQVMSREEPIGRRLDFLMQEFNREANTLGSKAAHSQYTQAAIDLKVLIEQMREQIQNIE